MSCKQFLSVLLFLLLCLSLSAAPSIAASREDGGETAALAAIEDELKTDEADARKPLISPVAGGVGLAALLIYGSIASRQQKDMESEGYEPICEEHCIGDPYSRLAGTKKRRRWF